MAEQFAAAPKVVKPKNKYKQQPQVQEEDEIKLIYNNLMWDKRIFRGNTYSAIVISKKNDNTYENKPSLQNRTRQIQQETTDNFEANKRASIEIFTDQFVQTLTDKPPKYEYGSQTEPLAAPAVVRHRMLQKIGQDIQTQIWDNELFDFDYEVEPLLNVLCGRTLQLSRMEVLQEEELRIMSNRQQELRLYQREQNKKIQKMYADEDNLQAQNISNIQKFKKLKNQRIKTHKKVFSRVLAKQFLKNIKADTLAYVQGNGFFRNPIYSRLVSEVLPVYYQKTKQLTTENQQSKLQALNLIEQAKSMIVKEHAWAKQVQRTRRQKIIQKRQEKEREKLERKTMKNEQAYMKKFLADQKKFLEEQQAKKREEEAKEAAQGGQQA